MSYIFFHFVGNFCFLLRVHCRAGSKVNARGGVYFVNVLYDASLCHLSVSTTAHQHDSSVGQRPPDPEVFE